ncbi:MAG: MerR family transcriptional regulator [Phascolarctobacterium sp.]|uniref:MerR family transcriptional regulator n=1 Tax=Phascolarctobacterium sp. TaxID=2049039 RepID=UPI0026DBA1F9|nr:MerR family transcriptional regulator [Phascolarctobacterium sp.]MDO4920650.1 MerR family transcriptional regulator [Phascolarctobacterium sp.]
MTIKEVSEKYHISADTLRYYERVGMIPPVPRTVSGIRNYGESECVWIELVVCMRNAGLPIEAIIEYVKLCQVGSSTIDARLQLLQKQRDKLLAQQEKTTQTLALLAYKISVYEQAVATGQLQWTREGSRAYRWQQ